MKPVTSGPTSPSPTDLEAQQVRANAQQLLSELESSGAFLHRRMDRAFIGVCVVVGALSVVAGLAPLLMPQWFAPGQSVSVLPFLGGTLLMVVMLALAVWQRDSQLARNALSGALVVMYLIAVARNGVLPIAFMAGMVVLFHALTSVRAALTLSVANIAAAVWIVEIPTSGLAFQQMWRELAASGLVLAILQFLLRQHQAFKPFTVKVTQGLRQMADSLASELSLAREARRQAEQALAAQKEADERLAAMTSLMDEALRCMTQGLGVLDAQGRYVMVNDRFCELLDLPREMMQSKPLLHDLVTFQTRRGDFGDQHCWVEGDAQAYIKGLGLDPAAPMPPTYTRRTGDGRYLEVSSHQTPSGLMVRTYSDITAYKEVSEQLQVALNERDFQLEQTQLAHRRELEALRARDLANDQRQVLAQLLSSAVESLPQGIFVFDRQGHLQVFNDKVCDLLQMPKSLLETKPYFQELVDFQMQRQDFDQTFYDDRVSRHEYPQTQEEWARPGPEVYIRPSTDGRYLEVTTHIMSSGFVIRTYADVTSYIQTTRRLEQVVTERDLQLRRAEQARDEAAQALSEVRMAQAQRDEASGVLLASMKSLAYGVLVTDAEGRITSFNDRVLELLDLPAQLLLGQPWFLQVVDFQLHRGDFLEDAQEIRHSLENWLHAPGAGQTEPVQPYVERTQHLGPKISRLVRHTLENWTHAPGAGQAQAAQPDAERLHHLGPKINRLVFGFEPGQYHDTSSGAVEPGPEPSASSRSPGVPPPAPGPEGPYRYTRRTRDGRILEVTGVFLSSGGVVRTYADVTSYVQANEKLEKSLSKLRLAQAQVQAELARSKVAMEGQARFVAAVSHEIRTPLNGIVGMVDLLSASPLNVDQRSRVEDLRTSAEQLHRLTDDILDLAKVGDGGFQFQTVRFDLLHHVRSCVMAAQAVAQGKSLEVELTTEVASCEVMGDPHRLAQILNNLLFNAIKFTSRGAVRVTAGWVPHPSDEQAVQVQVSVADSGRGIEPSLLGKIFEPFHQGEDSTNRNFGGTGLGLTLCRQLCEAMGGDITVASRPGHGSVFTFRVRMQKAVERADLPSPAPRPGSAEAALAVGAIAGARILVVEDNRINQKLLQAWLGQAGATVVMAADGREGVNLAREGSFDCILMDMSMPVLNGLEATREIRNLERAAATEVRQRAWVPIIGVTAMARREDRQLCLDAGMDAHVAKPFKREELFRTMNQLLDDFAWLRSAQHIYSSRDMASVGQEKPSSQEQG